MARARPEGAAGHRWFAPLWRRLLVIAVCLGWVAIEAWNDPSSLWLWVALAVTCWGVYDFFFAGRYGRGAGDGREPG
jgi:membrane-bound metal-dependent hydrolase YbcI (DUF457 family)